MKNLIFIAMLALISCKSVEEGELEVNVLNDTLVTYDYRLKKDTINIVEVEMINNTDEIFYFNNIYNSDRLISELKSQELLSKNIYNFRIFDCYNKVVSYDEINYRFDNMNDSIYRSINRKILDVELRRLKSKNNYRYFSSPDYNRFFIYPKQKLYVEFYLNLTDTLSFEYDRIRTARLSKNQEYYTQLFLISDSTDYKTILPRDILKTIKANNIKVYHGIIESKNKIPIKVIE